MSIINEALKKTEQNLHQNEARNTAAAKIFIHSVSPVLIYILILLVGILLSKFIFTLLAKPRPKTIAPIVLAALPAQVAPAVEIKKTQEPTFVLNGIFFSDASSYALVNNQIVREFDTVDGAKVTRITTNTVELDSNGKSINLSTR